MGEGFYVFLGLLILAHVLLTPVVLAVIAIRQKKRIQGLEAGIDILKRKINRIERAAPSAADEGPEPESPPGPVAPTVEVAGPVDQTTTAGPDPVFAQAMEEKPVTPAPVIEDNQETAPLDEGGKRSIVSWVAEHLQGIGVWPPSVESGYDREAMLMQWWLPRIGGLLALLSALFFGVYINQETTPLFKCLELTAISLALTGAGRFMERKYRNFGGVILVTGLIMLYLTSVASYALSPTRVFQNPLTGSLVQAVVLLLICVVGLLRRSRTIVLLAFYFGFFLCIFMAWEGLREGALIASGLLFISGSVLSRKSLFKHLSTVAVPGSFLAVLAFPAMALVRTVEIPGPVSTQVFVNALFAGIVVLYLLGIPGRSLRSKILLSTGSSLAILSLFWFYRTFYSTELEWAALFLGGNMLVGSIAGWFTRRCGYLTQLLFVKATFLVGAWVILHYAGDLRWMILCLQAAVVAVAARRAGVWAMECATWAVAVVSLGFYVSRISEAAGASPFVWWMMVLYPAVITLVLAYQLRPMESAGGSPAHFPRTWGYGLVPLVAMALWHAVFVQTPEQELPRAFVCILYASVAISLIPIFSRRMVRMVSALSFAAACVHFCETPYSPVVIAALILAAVAGVYYLLQREDTLAVVGENLIYLLILPPVTLWMLQVLNNWNGQAIPVFLLGAGIVLGGLIPRVRHLGSWACLPPLVYLLSETSPTGAGFVSIVAFASGIAWLAVPVLVPGVKAGQGWARKGSAWSLLGAFLFWAYALLFGDPETPWIAGQLVLGSIALLLLLGAFRWPVPGYLLGALLFLATVAAIHTEALSGGAVDLPWKRDALLSACLLYAFSLLWFFLKPFPFAGKSARSGQFRHYSSGLAAVLFFATTVVTFRYEALGWMHWYTPILAISAFVMILLGLFCRDTVFRRLGLIALIFPLVRLFMVDVQDALHRIIAFAAASVLLTLLGYLYHRLAARLFEVKDG